MTRKYYCDVCHQSYDTEEEAVNCEEKHNAEARKKKETDAEKAKLANEINRLVTEYYAKFKQLPKINPTCGGIEYFADWHSVYRFYY